MTSTDKSAAEREAYISWLSTTYPHAYNEEDAKHNWRMNHVSALAWQFRASIPTADPGAVAPADALYDQIQKVLLAHRLSYTLEDEDSTLPLVDMLCTPNATDVSTGKEEITLICDAIYSEVLCPYFRTHLAAPSVPSAPAAEALCPNGEPWDDNPDGVVFGQDRGPRVNSDTGFWEGAEADEDEDHEGRAGSTPANPGEIAAPGQTAPGGAPHPTRNQLADQAIAAGYTPGASSPSSAPAESGQRVVIDKANPNEWPTKEMISAGMKRMFDEKRYSAPWDNVIALMFKDMLAAAPQAVQAGGEGGKP